jgi:hypothetical protein
LTLAASALLKPFAPPLISDRTLAGYLQRWAARLIIK